MLFHNNSSTFFIGKWGAWPLQNLVTIPKSVTEMGSLLNRGEPEGEHPLSLTVIRSLTEALLTSFTQFCSEGFPHGLPLGLVGRIFLLDRFHHQIHYIKQNPEVGAVSEGDGRFSDRTAAGSTVTVCVWGGREREKSGLLHLIK